MSALQVTGTALQRSWQDNSTPLTERVGPGLWSIPVPIPRNPLRYVIVYALELADGVAVVDTGWSTDEAWAALQSGLRTAGYAVGDVRAALITHIHPDHFGLAGRLREASGAWVALHPADAELIPARYGMDIDGLIARMRDLLRECGVPDAEREALTGASMGIREFVALAQPDVLLHDGARVALPGWDLTVVHTPGHSPGHVCFHETRRRMLISGDHVLPRISPNISVHAQQPGNPLAEFLDALLRVRALDVDEVLPAHEWRFRGLAERVDQLLRHHHDRIEQTAALVSGSPGITCWQATQRLDWSRGWDELTSFMRRAAVGETLAHLVLLEFTRKDRARRPRPGPLDAALTDVEELPQLRPQLVPGFGAEAHAHEASGGVVEGRHRHPRNRLDGIAKPALLAAADVTQQRPGTYAIGARHRRTVAVLLRIDTDERNPSAHVVRHGEELGQLAAARGAPGGEEVDHNRTAMEAAQRHGAAPGEPRQLP